MIKRILFFGLIILLCTSCPPKDDPFICETLLCPEGIIEGEWGVREFSVVVIGYEKVTNDFLDFTITFDDSNFTTKNSKGLLPETGKWKIIERISSAISTITLNDTIQCEISIREENYMAFHILPKRSPIKTSPYVGDFFGLRKNQ